MPSPRRSSAGRSFVVAALVQRAGISQRDVGRQVCLLFIGKPARAAAATRAPAGGRIEHQIEELGHQLERALLRAGRILAFELGQIRGIKPEKRRRNPPVGIEISGQRIGDALLVAAQAGELGETLGQIQINVVIVRAVAQRVAAGRTALVSVRPAGAGAAQPAGPDAWMRICLDA